MSEAIEETVEAGVDTPTDAPVEETIEEDAASEPTSMDALDFQDSDEDDVEAPLIEATPEPEPEPTPAEAASVEEPVVTPVAEPAAATPPVEPPAPFDREAARATAVQSFSERYKISEDQAERLATEPEKVLPELLGNMAVDVYEAIYNAFTAVAPNVIRQTIHQERSVRHHNTAFMTANPHIQEALSTNPALGTQVVNIGKFWREANPDATPEEAIVGMGEAITTMLKLTPKEAAPAAPLVAPEPIPIMPRKPAASTPGQDAPTQDLSEFEKALGFNIPDS